MEERKKRVLPATVHLNHGSFFGNARFGVSNQGKCSLASRRRTRPALIPIPDRAGLNFLLLTGAMAGVGDFDGGGGITPVGSLLMACTGTIHKNYDLGFHGDLLDGDSLDLFGEFTE